MFVHQLPSRASYEIESGDILTAVAGNSIGSRKHATALVGEVHAGFICTNGFRVLRNPKIDPYYLLFYLRSEYFLQQVKMLRTGAAIPNISDADLQNILIGIPEDDEMERVSRKVKESIELREKAKQNFASLKLNF